MDSKMIETPIKKRAPSRKNAAAVMIEPMAPLKDFEVPPIPKQYQPGAADICLYVPFEDKDKVKAAGCVWWNDDKVWVLPIALKKTNPTLYAELQAQYQGQLLHVTKEDSTEAKQTGARYRPKSSMWFGNPQTLGKKYGAVWLPNVPYGANHVAKANGARWSPYHKSWYTNKQGLENPVLKGWTR